MLADLRTALRSLAKSPGFVLVAVVALGLGLALSTTMFAVLDAVVNPYSAYRNADQLFTLSYWYGPRATLTRADLYRVVRDQARSFSAVVPEIFSQVTLGAREEEADLFVRVVPPRWFAVVGVEPRLGRTFTDADGDGVAVLSQWLWKRLYGRRRTLEGARVTLSGRTYAVVGVLSREASPTTGPAAWLPLPPEAESSLGAPPLVRLKPGVTAEQATAELKVLSDALTASRGAHDYPYALTLWPVRERQGELRDIHKAMVGAALAVLLIACANLAHLMLARGVAKRREFAVRMALGATRAAVVRLMLAECALITVAGGALGMVAALWGRDILETKLPSEVRWIGFFQPQLSWRVFALAAAAAAVSAVLFGLVPALRVTFTLQLSDPLKDAAATATVRTRGRYSPLVISEVALALVLMMGGGLLLRTVQRIQARPDELHSATLLQAYVGRIRASAGGWAPVDWQQVLATAQATPGVRDAALLLSRGLPGFALTGELSEDTNQLLLTHTVPVVSPSYLRVLGIPVVRGRDFEPGDAVGNGAAIVNAVAAERLYPHRDPVGRMVKLGGPLKSAPWVPIVGVARAVSASREGTESAHVPEVWITRRDSAAERIGGGLVIRTASRDPRTAVAVRRRLREVPGVGGAYVMSYARERDAQIASRAFLAKVFVGMGAIALALAALGLYGVLSYAATQRMREYGVRLALGAEPRTLFRMVLHEGVVMLLAGIGAGAFVALAGARLLDAVLVDVLPSDVVSLVAAEAVLLSAGLAAALGPARRAARANPLDIIRAI